MNKLVGIVKFKDKDITTKKYDNKPMNLGSAPLVNSEEKVLANPTNHTVYKKVIQRDVELEIEACFAKGRWGDMEQSTKNNADSITPEKCTYDKVNKTLNFQNIRATDLKSNKRVNIVDNGDLKHETKCENLKIEMLKTVEKYTKENENKEYSNLSNDEQKGLKSLTDKVQEDKLVVIETDKSKKFVVNTPEQFISDMEVHVKGDKIVDKKFISKTTRKYNEMCKSLVKIVNMGQNQRHLQRILNNVHVDLSSELPHMRGLFKDHKHGRKYRPLVNGNVGPISSLSEILSVILKGYMLELQQMVGPTDTIKSTEELLSQFESYNKSINQGYSCDNCDNQFIASMDVESLYPSLEVESTSTAIKQVILNSNMCVEGVNVEELGVYLRKNMTPDVIQNSIFKEFIPLKKKKVKKSKSTHEYETWSFSDKKPDHIIIKQMLAECMCVATKFLMNNHIYEFGGNVHVQEGNGSIGVQFTGIAGEIYMLLWCSKLKDKLSKLNIVNKFQHRMVDDITILPNVIQPGTRFEDDKLVIKADMIYEDKLIEADIRTMNVIQKVANSIDKNIRVTYDVPSLHEDGRVPILDVKVRTDKCGRVEYIFYKKPAKNRFSVLKNSALSIKNKMTILTQECFRRLHNTSELVEDSVKADILNEFMVDLQLSGYNEKEREDILLGGFSTYSNLKAKEIKGIRPFYRSRDEQNSENKNKKVKNWFRKGQYSDRFKTVMFVDATPGDKLLKMLRHTESQFMVSENFRMKFVSKAGVKLKSILKCKSIKDRTCSENDGSPCVMSEGRGIKNSNCKQNIVN